MSDKNSSRRSYLKLSGAGLASVVASSVVTAKESTSINTDFNPEKKGEVVQFAKELQDVENLQEVYKQLNEKQKEAVREVLQPQKVTLTYNETLSASEAGVEAVASSDWSSAKATARAYAEGADGIEVWSFGVEATWQYDGTSVRNVDAKHAVSTNHPMWHWKKIVDETNSVYDAEFQAYKQGKFSYCEPLGMGCIKSATPYIEHTGTASGTHTTESNYKQK